MLKACGCVNFWMPRNKTTRICQLSDMKCIYTKEASMGEEDHLACHCLPSCNNIQFKVGVTSINLDPKIFGVDRNE